MSPQRELDALLIKLGRAAIAVSRVPSTQSVFEAVVAKNLILHQVTVLAVARALAGGRE